LFKIALDQSIITLSTMQNQFRQRFILPLSLLTSVLFIAPHNMTIAGEISQKSSQIVAQVPTNYNIIYVNQNIGKDTPGGGTEIAPYRSITYALQQAQSGTIVQVAPGNYTTENGEIFPLLVKPGVILRGDETTRGANINIVGGGGFLSPTMAGQNITVRALQDSQIRGVTVANPNSRGSGIWVESANPVIMNNTFTKSNREGVFLTGTSNPKVQGNIFSQNLGNGISIAKASQGEIIENLFDNTGSGIVLSETSAPIIANNRISNNRDGVVISGTAKPSLRNNIIENNRDNGLVNLANATPDLGTTTNRGQNRIRNNGKFDIYHINKQTTLIAIGNDTDYSKISGNVDLGYPKPATTKPTTPTKPTVKPKPATKKPAVKKPAPKKPTPKKPATKKNRKLW
jgi:parallel beta-helix repeat protein